MRLGGAVYFHNPSGTAFFPSTVEPLFEISGGKVWFQSLDVMHECGPQTVFVTGKTIAEIHGRTQQGVEETLSAALVRAATESSGLCDAYRGTIESLATPLAPNPLSSRVFGAECFLETPPIEPPEDCPYFAQDCPEFPDPDCECQCHRDCREGYHCVGMFCVPKGGR